MIREPLEPAVASPLAVATAARGRETLAMVRRALVNRDAMLAFQPVMGADPDRGPVFYEGLIRLLDETGRIIPAADFMGAVEPVDIGRVIDCLSLELALKALAQDRSLRLSVNMSARSIAYPLWAQTLRRGTRQCPDAAERLILEITEGSAMMLPEIVAVFMSDLQKQGISFALDDFGAGATSFRALRQFYFDFAKIDGTFVRGLDRSPDNQCVVEALIAVARRFDMAVIAESVETEREAALLRSMGVDAMQGYLYGAPTVTPPWAVEDVRKRA